MIMVYRWTWRCILIVMVLLYKKTNAQFTSSGDSRVESSCDSNTEEIQKTIEETKREILKTIHTSCKDNSGMNLQANCLVQMRSYGHIGCSSPNEKYGYIKLNGAYFLNASYNLFPNAPNLRGVNMMILDPYKCTASGWRTFDTYDKASEAQNLVDYLNYLSTGSVIIVVSFDESTRYLDRALNLFTIVGADVSFLRQGAKFAFIMQKGYPTKTAIRYVQPSCQPVVLTTRVTGTNSENLVFTVV